MINIIVASDFSITPGGRYIIEGPDSGEKFYKDILKPCFKKAIKENKKLFVDLDGTYGYPSSFIDQSFGELSREYGCKKILNIIEMKSDDESDLINQIKDNIIHPEKYCERKK